MVRRIKNPSTYNSICAHDYRKVHVDAIIPLIRDASPLINMLLFAKGTDLWIYICRVLRLISLFFVVSM